MVWIMQAMLTVSLVTFADRIMLKLLKFLEPSINDIFASSKNNGLVENSVKSHFLVSPYEKISLKILVPTIQSCPSEELLRMTIDS